jgi:hypothetical protein
MNTKFKEITYEVGNGPNGLKVPLSVMEMISRYGVQGSGSYKVF